MPAKVICFHKHPNNYRGLLSKVISIVFLVTIWAVFTWGQSGSSGKKNKQSFDAPLYDISFKQGDPIPGIGAMPAIRLPFQCTADGTVFVTMVQPLGTDPKPRFLAKLSLSPLVVSVARAGEAHSFLLDKVPGLVDVTYIDQFASDSKVIFLLRASRDDGEGSMRLNEDESAPKKEHHLFIAVFDRSGNYQKTMQMDDAIEVYQLGIFPSGNYLVYGYDKVDHAPVLVMLKDDTTILSFLSIPKGDVPDSALGTLHGDGKGPSAYLGQVQFLGQGHSIYVSQNKAKFPLLEVSEAGAIRPIHAKLESGTQIKMLIPSDENLYALVDGSGDDSIYELNPQTGAITRRLRLNQDNVHSTIACVNGKEFLSFKNANGRLLPLVGTAEIASDDVRSGQKKIP